MADETRTDAPPPAEPGDTPAERIARRIRGWPAKGYVEVDAEDVLAVVALVPPAKRTPVVAALEKGSRNAPRQTNEDGEPVPSPVHPEAGKLRQLLEAAGVHTE